MKILSSLEIKAIVEELQVFIDGRVDKIYQPDNSEIILTVHKTGIGRKHIRIVPGVGLYVAKKKRMSPNIIINFCRFLRKRIGGNRIRKIIQKDFERIIEIHFEGKENKFIMICEFFSKGNVILCDENYTIISALQVQLWKDRKIKARVEYLYPPSRPINFNDFEEFALYIEKSDKKDIVRKLATLNLGGMFAEEVCFRAGVDKNQEKVDARDLKKLFVKLNELLSEKKSANIVNNEAVPFEMKSLGEGVKYESFSEALDVYYTPFIDDLDEGEDVERLTKVDKQNIILKEQEKQKIEFEKEIVEGRKIGDWIYENYILIQELFDLYKEKKYKEIIEKGYKIKDQKIEIKDV